MRSLVIRLLSALARRGDGGQATAEYALVLLGAALVALLLIAWATAGGGAGGGPGDEQQGYQGGPE